MVTSTLIQQLGIFLPTFVIPVSSIAPHEEPLYRSRLEHHYLLLAAVYSIVGIICTIFFRAKPPSPISLSAEVERIPHCKACKRLLGHGSFLLLAFFFGLKSSNYMVFQYIIGISFKDYGVTPAVIHVFSLMSFGSIIVFFIIYALFCRGIHSLKSILLAIWLFHLINLFLVLFFLHLEPTTFIGICIVLQHGFAAINVSFSL